MKSCVGGEVVRSGGEGSSAESLVCPGVCDMDEKELMTGGTDVRKVEIRPFRKLGEGPRDPLPPTYGGTKQAVAAAIVSLLALVFGTSIGWRSPVQPLLQSDKSPVGQLSEDEMSWLASLIFIGGIAGTFLWSRVADRYGRKAAGYSVAAPFVFGWGMSAFSNSSKFLLAGRFLNGLGGSGALILAPLYIGEIAQDSIRGALGSFVVLSFNAGIVLAYLLGAILPYHLFNYVCFSIPVCFLVLFFWLPETPQYLWTNGKKHDAENSLLWFRGGNFKCLQEETLEYSYKKNEDSVSYRALFDTQGKRKGMMIGLGLFTWQQFCGILAILSYTSFIFQTSGSSISPDRATIIVGVFQLFASFMSSIIVDRSGRKMLLLISYMFMGLSLTTLGGYFYMEEMGIKMSSFSWIPVVSLSTHVLTYALGAGPVPYVVMSETLPQDIRALAQSVIIFWGTLLAFISVKIFPLLIFYTNLYGCFWFFSIFCYVGFLFTWSFVPETKGIPLMNILRQLNGESIADIVP